MRDEPASEIARSSAIQHIIFDSVKWRGSLRTSQMPESGGHPDLADEIGDLREPLGHVAIQRVARARVEPRALEQRPVDVELRLADGSVARTDGSRTAVAVQWEDALSSARIAVEPIQDLEA